MPESKEKKTYHFTYADLSHHEERFGFRGHTLEGTYESAKKGANYSVIDRGLLIRLVDACEKMGAMLELACEPMATRTLERRNRRRGDLLEAFTKAFSVWLDEQEAKHGPCPPLVARALREDGYSHWMNSVSDLRMSYSRGSGRPYLAGRLKIPKKLDWWALPTARSYGPRSKTRREWESWRKRRVRRKRTPEATNGRENHA